MSDENIEKLDSQPEPIQPTIVDDASIEIKRILAKPSPSSQRAYPPQVTTISNTSVSLKYWLMIILNLFSILWIMALRYYPTYQRTVLIDEFTIKTITDWVEKYSFPLLLTSSVVVLFSLMFMKTASGATNNRDNSSSNPVLGSYLGGFISSLYILLPVILIINWHLDKTRFGYPLLIIGFIGIVIWLVMLIANIVYLVKRTNASRNDFVIVANFAFFTVVVNQLTILGLSSWLVWKQFIAFKII